MCARAENCLLPSVRFMLNSVEACVNIDFRSVNRLHGSRVSFGRVYAIDSCYLRGLGFVVSVLFYGSRIFVINRSTALSYDRFVISPVPSCL